MGIVNLTDDNFPKEFDRYPIAIVDFFAGWCAPCRMLAPVIDALSEKRKDIAFFKMDIDHNQKTAKKFKVTSIPTVILFKDGKQIDKFLGFRTEEEIEKWLRKI